MRSKQEVLKKFFKDLDKVSSVYFVPTGDKLTSCLNNDLLLTVSLKKEIVSDTYGGLKVTIVSKKVGRLETYILDFKTFTDLKNKDLYLYRLDDLYTWQNGTATQNMFEKIEREIINIINLYN